MPDERIHPVFTFDHHREYLHRLAAADAEGRFAALDDATLQALADYLAVEMSDPVLDPEGFYALARDKARWLRETRDALRDGSYLDETDEPEETAEEAGASGAAPDLDALLATLMPLTKKRRHRHGAGEPAEPAEAQKPDQADDEQR